MKPGNLEISGIALTLLVTAALFLFTAPFGALSACRMFPLISAFGLTVMSLLLRCSVWMLLVSAAITRTHTGTARPERNPESVQTGDPVTGGGNTISFGGLFVVSVISLIGTLTPMRLGTDLLRSVYGKQRLGLGFETTAAASILTREFKLRTSLFLAIGLMLGAACFQANLLRATTWSMVGLLLALACFISLRTDTAGKLAKRLHADSFVDAARTLHQKVGCARRSSIYLIFVLGFLTEWASLFFCFHALGIRTTLLNTIATYLILYFLSTTPFLPQGTGVVEPGAFILLHWMHVPTGQAGALIVIWNCVRILTPPLLSALVSLMLILRFGQARNLENPLS